MTSGTTCVKSLTALCIERGFQTKKINPVIFIWFPICRGVYVIFNYASLSRIQHPSSSLWVNICLVTQPLSPWPLGLIYRYTHHKWTKWFINVKLFNFLMIIINLINNLNFQQEKKRKKRQAKIKELNTSTWNNKLHRNKKKK